MPKVSVRIRSISSALPSWQRPPSSPRPLRAGLRALCVKDTSSSASHLRSDRSYAPFGETYAASGSTDPAFTTQRQDTVAGLYDFPAREYSIQGRWPSPDPAGLAAVDLSNPQSWNRFAYVLNDPLAWIDPLGLDAFKGDDCPWEASCEPGSGGIGIGIGILFGGGHGGGGGNNDGPQSGGGNNPPIPPPNNPGTTFPGTPVGQAICITIRGAQICASRPYPSWFVNLANSLGGAGLVTKVFLQALGNNFVDEFKTGGCVNFFFKASWSAANPFSSSPTIATDVAAGTMTVVSPAVRWTAAQVYAASRTSVVGRGGLLFPQNSRPYNQILNGNLATTLTEGGVAYVDGALAQGFFAEMEALGNGTCQ